MKRRAAASVLLLACGKVASIPGGFDAGAAPAPPTVSQVVPDPGPVDAAARFTVTFSAPMNEGQLLAGTGRSETVVLAAEAQVEQVAAALQHDSLSAFERTLLVPAAAQIGPGHGSLTLLPDAPLQAGSYYLLVSPRLKDDAGDKLQGNGARFAFSVEPPPERATLVSPVAGAQAPLNLSLVRALAASGAVALVTADGTVVASVQADAGAATLSLPSPLAAGGRYWLSLDGAVDASQGFAVSSCPRSAPPVLQNGRADLTARDSSVLASFSLDWPVAAEVRVGLAADGDPCSAASCLVARKQISCAPDPCGPQAFICNASVPISGLSPATAYALRIVATDDFGISTEGAVQAFSTLAPLPRLLVSEVMATPASPETNAEYVEILNLGPGSALLDGLGFLTPDGVVRPLSGTPPPTPVLLRPGERALAAGSAFDPSRYPGLPPQVPVLRASTQRLLSHGLGDVSPQPFQLVAGTGHVPLSGFPGGAFHCAVNQSLQREESAPPEADAGWSCGPDGGTPGAPP
jgi:hypothetical protein